LRQNIIAARKHGTNNPETFMFELTRAFLEIKKQVTANELKLKQYDWREALIASGIRLGNTSYYYKFSASYFHFINELADDPKLKNVALMNVKLNDEYLFFFTILGSLLLASLDVKIMGLNNTACLVMNNIGQQIFNIEQAISIGKKFGVGDTTVVQLLPPTKQIIGFELYALLYTALWSWKPRVITYLETAFATATLCRNLTGYLLDKQHKKSADIATEKSWTLFIKQPIQHVAALAGQYSLKWPYEYITSHFPMRQLQVKLYWKAKKHVC